MTNRRWCKPPTVPFLVGYETWISFQEGGSQDAWELMHAFYAKSEDDHHGLTNGIAGRVYTRNYKVPAMGFEARTLREIEQ